MNKLARKLTAAGLCAALCVTCAGVAFAQTTGKVGNPSEKASQSTQTAQQKTQSQNSKNETVYVLAGADGSVQKIIVSDWIKNALGSDAISDKSQLSGIENVKGDEGYTLDENNMTVWDAKGNDIYYQGSIEKELPVKMTVSYQLDGKTISPEDLAGKSGRVTIRFDYENMQYEMVQIDGKNEKIYVPFAMLTGMLLDSDIFRNVHITNGKLLNDGDHTVVVGLAFPGLQENLGISSETLEFPSYVELTADVTDFEFGMTVTVATNEIFNQLDADNLELTDLDGSLGELTDAMTQLLDGSSALYDGLCTLLEKSDELVSGVKELAAGAASLKNGADKLSGGADQVAAGAEKLSTGLGTLSSNSADLNDGAAQVFNTLLATATTQIRAAGIAVPELTIDSYAEVLNGVIAGLDETAVYDQALQQVTAAVEAKRPELTQLVTTQVISSATGMSLETYQAAVAAGMISAQQQTQLNAVIEENVEKQVALAIQENMKSDAVQSQLAAAAAGRKTIEDLKASLDSYKEFYQGVLSYTGGVDEAAVGAGELKVGTAELKDGASELKAGADKLYKGVLALQEGMPTLVNGITQLRDGAMSLSEGMKQFNDEGIQRLVELVDEDLDGIVLRLKATVEVSKAYTSFSGIADGMDGQVKFIYRTDEITCNG